MNHSEISCATVHPYVRQIANNEVEEDELLDQIAQCAAKEFSNHTQDLAPQANGVAFDWPSFHEILVQAIELALYTHKAITEEEDVTIRNPTDHDSPTRCWN